mmetsp:Transcript_12925/g.21875  ORF Transcript_12925/g.21875 Transcript_12925/m.21875 type:complete len:122 (-) Transcript_12925:410-775(-)
MYKNHYLQHPTPTHYCFFDIEIDGKEAGRLDFELFGKEAPKTVNNFLGLCSGEIDRRRLWYKDSSFHQIHLSRWIMGGDIVNRDGSGSISVYDGKATFKAETNELKFSEPYLLAAAADDQG